MSFKTHQSSHWPKCYLAMIHSVSCGLALPTFNLITTTPTLSPGTSASLTFQIPPQSSLTRLGVLQELISLPGGSSPLSATIPSHSSGQSLNNTEGKYGNTCMYFFFNIKVLSGKVLDGFYFFLLNSGMCSKFATIKVHCLYNQKNSWIIVLVSGYCYSW